MNNRSKIRDVIKTVFQCSVIIFEYAIVFFVFVYLSNKILPCNTVVDLLERGMSGYGMYSLIIQLTLDQANDAKKDSYMSLVTAYKLAIEACENEDKDLVVRANATIKKHIDDGSIFHYSNIREEYISLQKLFDNKELAKLKSGLIFAEHNLSMSDLKWKSSILLRLIK